MVDVSKAVQEVGVMLEVTVVDGGYGGGTRSGNGVDGVRSAMIPKPFVSDPAAYLVRKFI